MISPAPFFAHSRPHLDAAELSMLFGEAAPEEAAMRAERARALGNHLHLCRWREVGRLLATLSEEQAAGTIH